MSSNVGKKSIAHKGSNHGVVAPAAISLLTPPAPPAPSPFPYTARAVNASATEPKIKVGTNEVLVQGSTMNLDPPANQPAQAGGGDVVTHATKHIAVMTTGSILLMAGGKGICGTGDIAAVNVLTKQSKFAQIQLPLLEGADFDTASKSNAAAAAMNRLYRRAFPPSKANQTRGGHPVDLGTGYVVDDAVDLRLPGLVPLIWSRSYSSAAPSHFGALGKGGWSHSFEQRIEVTEIGLRFHNEEGLPVDFEPLRENGTSFHRGQRLELRVSGRGFEIRSLHDRLIRTFLPLPSGKIALHSIRDARLHRIQLEYEGNVLTRVVDTAKREIRLTNDARSRITRVEVWAAEPGSEQAPSLQTWFEYAYHQEGELASHTNALGHAENWQYDGLHRMVETTLRNRLSFYYAYDEDSGHCVRTWGEGGLHDVRLSIDFEKGETLTHGTNRSRRYLWKNGIVCREETFGGEWVSERVYDEDELLIAVRNGAGEATIFEYDARANLVKQTDPAGNVSRWEYADDVPLRRIDPLGLETRYDHHSSGVLIAVTFPTGLSYRVDLDEEGRLGAIYGNEGCRAKLGYDEHSNLASELSARGATTQYRNDSMGRPTTRMDAIGRKSNVDYDKLGRIVTTVRPDGSRSHYEYDRLGNLARATDPLGQVTQLEYSGTGVLARAIQPNGQVYRFIYDSDERLVQIMNPRLEKYEFEYDRADQIVTERTFDGRLICYRYARAGRIVRVEYPEGEWREFSHDKLGNVIEDRGVDVQVAFARDALGRVEKAICQDITGTMVTELERDRFGRLTADIQNGRAVRYEYDEKGRCAARTLPDGERTQYHFDHDDYFSGVTHGGSEISIERDALGRERTRQAHGWKVESDYDDMDRLLTKQVTKRDLGGAAPKVLAARRFGYDAKGRQISADCFCGGLTTYRYDRIDQLIEASRAGIREVFEYDPTGSLASNLNALGEAGRRACWSFAPGNQLLASNSAKYINDGRARRIQRVEQCVSEPALQGNGRSVTYGWDTKDRLREIICPDGSRVRFTYDAFGRRTQKDVLRPFNGLDALMGTASVPGRRTVQFLWDGDVLCEERDTAKPLTTRKRVHVHEPETFVPMLQSEGGEIFGVIHDHLGTPKELVDREGRIVWRATHGAWGNLLDFTRDRGAAEVESPFRLLGQYADEETGLSYTRYRYFEAATGRWLCPDPLGVAGGLNLLAFDGSPILRSDPFGLCTNGGSVDLVGNRRVHILNRHKFGVGMSQKTEFPDGWSADQIMHAASDVATNSNSARGVGGYNSPFALGIHDGVVIRVDFYPATNPNGTPHPNAGKVSTAYPTSTPINP